MVTPAELKAAGGSMARAQVAKAADLVAHVRAVQGGLDDRLRELVRAEVEFLLLDAKEATASELRKGLVQALKRAVDGAGAFTLRDALKILGDERAALLPYTDQRQPQAVEVKGEGFAPSVVVQVESGAAAPRRVNGADAEIIEQFGAGPALVAHVKSHDDPQDTENPDLFAP
ncbi:hypothetical protein [Phenylobacterium sp. SCN 70-31]|uniref:hypothetical protein n=1 Tax=Phenylobacterium sp. SCN 70-31 TaxID=1660129 RepID=UPI00086DBAA4|nr:hypothetical protein [Phenylobacterium sp. SCN 70-31]ODT88122.1 MAG: hypothetical protein ABS78_09530 [Phenylobacterium sp. SCN 70-31]